MPTRPANTRSLLHALVELFRISRAHGQLSTKGDAERAQGLTRELFVGVQDLRAPLVGSRVSRLSPTNSWRSARAIRPAHLW